MTEPLNFIFQATARGYQRQMNHAQKTITNGHRRNFHLRLELQLKLLGDTIQRVFYGFVNAINSVDWAKIAEQIEKGFVNNESKPS